MKIVISKKKSDWGIISELQSLQKKKNLIAIETR